jgi:hypothetical protein
MQIRLIKKQVGLGDAVESVLKMTGIHQLTNLIVNGDAKIPCVPCMERKEKLNK